MSSVDRILLKLGASNAAIARELDVTRQAVQMWRKRGVIPRWNHPAILAAAKRKGIEIPRRDMIAAVMGE